MNPPHVAIKHRGAKSIASKGIRLRPWTLSKLKHLSVPTDITIDECLTRIITHYTDTLQHGFGGICMSTRCIDIACFDPDCQLRGMIVLLSGVKGSYATYVCEHQRQAIGIVDGTFWTAPMIIRAHELRELGHDYARITQQLNEEFHTSFEGAQRPGGKGFRGAVSRKFARMAKFIWSQQDTDDDLIERARHAFSVNEIRKNSGQQFTKHEDDELHDKEN
jgi:hypothetical protein